jgi:phage terminase large subunit-like protein
MDAWDACDVTGDVTKLAKVRAQMLDDLKGRQAIGWLDLSSVTDITTFGLLFPQPNGDVIPLPWFFLPRENLDRRGELDHAHYRSWADHGFLELTDGTRNDYRAVRALIQRVREDYKFTDIAYDDWNAGGIETLLTEEDGFTMIPIRQNISTLSQPTKELLGLTLTGQMKHGGNPVLRYMADKFVVKEDQNERVMPLKNKATGRIDGIMGIVFALSRFLRPEPEEEETPSIYSTRGIITL